MRLLIAALAGLSVGLVTGHCATSYWCLRDLDVAAIERALRA